MRKKLHRTNTSISIFLGTVLVIETMQKPQFNLKEKDSPGISVQLVCRNVQTHISSEPQLEYNHDQVPLNLGIYRNIMQFRLVLKGKAGKEILTLQNQSSQKRFWPKICFIRCCRQHCKQNSYSRLIFLKNIFNHFPKAILVKFLGTDKLFCFISTSKIGNLNNNQLF